MSSELSSWSLHRNVQEKVFCSYIRLAKHKRLFHFHKWIHDLYTICIRYKIQISHFTYDYIQVSVSVEDTARKNTPDIFKMLVIFFKRGGGRDPDSPPQNAIYMDLCGRISKCSNINIKIIYSLKSQYLYLQLMVGTLSKVVNHTAKQIYLVILYFISYVYV